MARLPVMSGRELIKLLEKNGFQQKRQKGSHVILVKDNKVTVVPLHKEVDRGTLIEIIRQCGFKREEFLQMISKK
ncbi:MAG TPA: type II toxin-antitoxin system HicA family toxin [archaeon]|nr:type II toxin-antitoxin system HicA family toxin [archaeon]